MRKITAFKKLRWLAGALVCLLAASSPAWAVVGQAETYDPFKQEDLDAFHNNLTREDNAQRLSALQMQKNFQQTSGQKTEGVDQQLNDLQRDLLSLPKRRRISLEGRGTYTYDSNVARAVPRQENDDSLFDTDSALLFDLSGKKTDLRFEVNGGKHWSVEYPEGDSWTAGERIRYRRRYFKKVQHSFQSALSRHSEKSIELDVPKVRWDSAQNTSYNYPLTNKISINTEFTSNMRTFTQEAFDQDSSWEATAAPAMFYNVTPKTRLSLGYRLGTNHIRTKSGDANTHEVHLGYFGKITRKSSASVDLSYGHQTPKSRDTEAINTYTMGVGYIWQITGKTQLTLQAIRSLQNTSSNLESGTLDGENGEPIATSKTDSRITNDSISASLNSRLSSRLTATSTINFSHTHTGLLKGVSKDGEITQFTFPVGFGMTYYIKRWATLSLGYTFAYRTGYEKQDRYRDHLLTTTLRLIV